MNELCIDCPNLKNFHLNDFHIVKRSDYISNSIVKMLSSDRAIKLERLTLFNVISAYTVPETKTKGSRYTPLSKRADKPNGIYWFIKNLPELPDSKICRIIGTTKKTVQSIRDRSYWNIQNVRAQNPFELGLCNKEDIEAVIDKYRNKD